MLSFVLVSLVLLVLGRLPRMDIKDEEEIIAEFANSAIISSRCSRRYVVLDTPYLGH